MLSLIQIQSVSAQPTTVLTPKWTRSGLGTNWEGGLVIGDVTGDGVEDVVYAGGGSDRVYVLNGNNGNTIATYTNTRISQYCQPQLYDVDGDGVLDILVPLYYQPGLAAVKYDGSSALTQMWVTTIQQGSDPLGSVMAKPVAGDIDGDGDLDIFIASQDVSPNGGYDGTIVRLDHNGNIVAQSFSWRACSGGLSLGDTDNDGVFEVYQGDREMSYTDGGYGKGAKSFWADDLSERWIRLDSLTSSQAPVLVDYNGDGILEVIAGMYGSRDGIVIHNSTNGQIIQRWNNRDLSIHYGITVYDIDGDGNLELLCNDGDHDDQGFSDVFDLVTGTMDAQLSMGPGVLTLNEWTGEYALVGGDSKWSPVVADIDPTHTGMEIISVPNGTGLDGGASWNGAIMIWSSNYESLQNITRAPGTTPGTYSTSRLGSQMAYPVVQDIDDDGLLELVTHASSGTVYAFDTIATAPTGSERIRSEVTYFGEARVGVAEHTIAPWEPNYWTAPLVAPITPKDNALAVPVNIGEFRFQVREHQDQAVTYSVTTSPNVGSTSGSLASGNTYDWTTLSVNVANLAYDTTYTWTVSVSDGSEVTSRTYTFRTELAPNAGNNAPTQSAPSLIATDGIGATTSTFQCTAQGTTDTDGDSVSNLYRWRMNGQTLAQLLLPFDVRDETTTADLSGNNNHGTVKGAAWVPNGRVGGAYSFDGVDDAIVISDGGVGYFNGQSYSSNREELGGFGNWNEITVEAWIYLNQYNTGSRLVAKIPSYALGFSSFTTNRLYASVWPYTGEVADDENAASVDREQSVTANVNLNLNTWYHVAFTYENGVGLKLYLDGQLIGQRSVSAGPLSNSRGEPLYIGRLVEPFNGMIDEVRIYNYAQAPEQILNRYTESKDGDSSSSLFSPFGVGSVGDFVSCDVIPTDSYTSGAPASTSPLTIVNSPPIVSNLIINPVRDREYRLDNENLGASYSFYDADGNVESGSQIRWYRNGALQSGLNDLLTVPASSTSNGDIWYFTVMPRDGIGFGDLQTSPTITIRSNAAPTTGTPLIDSVNGGIDYDDDDLIGTAVGTTDANGDVTTNIYRWLLNGESVTNLQMHFDTEVPQIPGVNGITRDYSGFGNNGVVNGSYWTQTGVIGGALSFDGNDYIRVQDNGNSLGSDGSWSKLSIEYWIKANGTSNQEAVISKHNADYSTGGFQGASYGIGYSSDFRAYANRDRFFWEVFNDTGSAEVQYSEYATFGQWHHVVCTYESGVGLKLYIDGLERASTPFSGNINATSDGLLFIGGTGAGGEFIGLLDEVIIYDSVLSPYQVYQRYVDTKDGVSDSETIVCTSTSAGDVWRCEVIPNDSWTDGAPQLSASLTVSSDGNSAPKIYYYEPVGSTLNADLNQNITFIQFSSDPELAPLTYSWSVDSVEQATTKDLTYNFTTAGSHTVVVTVSDGALSASQSWTVTVNAGELRSLTIQAASNGNTNPAPGVYQYGLNTVALVEALPSAGYTLSYWLRNGSNVGTANPYLMVMDENYVLQPVFAQSSQYFLDVSVSGSGTTNATGIQYYDAGTSVTVQATANAGWLFSHWLVNGANVGTNSLLSLTMNANYECSAVFEQMPKLFEDGFESGDFSQWSTVVPTSGETYTVVDNLKYDGSYGARFTTNGDGGTERVYIYKNIGAQTELYVRGYFNLQSGLPLDNANNRFNIFSFVNAGAAIASMGVIRNQGADVWYINSGLGVWNATSGPATNQWYCVEFYIKIGSTDGALAVYIDGTPIISEVNRNTAALAASIDTVRCELVFVNGITHPLDLYSDCLAISNYYIGPIVEQAGQMSLAVTTNRERYLKWSNVDITVTAKDATTNALLQNANIAITVYDIHGRVAYTASGTTDANGVANFTYKLVFNAQMGTYTITATASLTGYDNGNGQASFYSLG